MTVIEALKSIDKASTMLTVYHKVMSISEDKRIGLFNKKKLILLNILNLLKN